MLLTLIIINRVSKICGIYRASQRAVTQHMKLAHKKEKLTVKERKIRHERVAARRAKELLCVFNEDTPDAEDAIWLDEKELDSDLVPVFSEDNSVQGMPVITNIRTWCSCQWTNDN